jgi:hypothetical protein
VQLLGGKEGGVAGEERDGDLGQRVVESAPDLCDDPSDGQANSDAAAGGDGEPERRFQERETSGGGGAQSHAVGDESGGVVDQALALDQVDDPSGYAEAPHDGCGGHRVRR